MLKKATSYIALATLAASICIVARAHAAPAEKTETITLDGGFFWGVEVVFEHAKGVVDTRLVMQVASPIQLRT